MKLVLDAGVSPRAAAALSADGHDLVHLFDMGAADWSDERITEWARSNGRAVVTFDRDFVRIAAHHGLTLPSIIHLRLRSATVALMIDLLLQAVRRIERELMTGAIVTIRRHRIHCRILPVHEPDD